jgi:hypothetical protein
MVYLQRPVQAAITASRDGRRSPIALARLDSENCEKQWQTGRAVDRAQKKRDYTKMPAIIKQWQEPCAQPTERPDAEDDEKKQESGGSSRADNQGFRRSIREEKRADSDKQRQVERDSSDQHNIVDAFLAIPGNSSRNPPAK